MEEKHDLERNRTRVQPNQHMSAGRYFATRFSTLKPPLHKVRLSFAGSDPIACVRKCSNGCDSCPTRFVSWAC